MQLFLTRAHSLSSASNEVNGDTLDSKVGAQGDRDMIGPDPNARMRQNFKNAPRDVAELVQMSCFKIVLRGITYVFGATV